MAEADAAFAAIEAGDLDLLRRLIAESPASAGSINSDGISLLLFARYRSQLDAVALLREALPALSFFEAAALGDTARVRELLDEREDLARAFTVDGFSGLQLAAFFGQPVPQ